MVFEEEAAVMATNFKWSNSMCILSLAGVLKVILLAFLLFCGLVHFAFERKCKD